MSQPQTISIKQSLSQAKKATKRGNAALALQLYQAVLQHQPDHPVAKKGARKMKKRAAQQTVLRRTETKPVASTA